MRDNYIIYFFIFSVSYFKNCNIFVKTMTTTLDIISLFIALMVITEGMHYCIGNMRIIHIPFSR